MKIVKVNKELYRSLCSLIREKYNGHQIFYQKMGVYQTDVKLINWRELKKLIKRNVTGTYESAPRQFRIHLLIKDF
jgi:hypothetical protein